MIHRRAKFLLIFNKFNELGETRSIYLFCQLLLTKFVQGEELSGKDHVLNETNTGEFHTNNDLSVRHHHGYCTEVDLQVLW